MVSFQSGRVGGELKTSPPIGKGTCGLKSGNTNMVWVELLPGGGARIAKLTCCSEIVLVNKFRLKAQTSLKLNGIRKLDDEHIGCSPCSDCPMFVQNSGRFGSDLGFF